MLASDLLDSCPPPTSRRLTGNTGTLFYQVNAEVTSDPQQEGDAPVEAAGATHQRTELNAPSHTDGDTHLFGSCVS